MKTALDAYEKAHPGIYFAVDEYQSALTILNAVKNEKTYDIALLDICMPGILGTDVAQEVLAKAPDTNIIFLTTSDEYAVDAFALNATHYLLKPFTQEKFDAAMDRAVEKMPEETVLFLACVDGMYRVRVSEVVSAESQGHYLFYHLTSGKTIKQRGKLTQIYEDLQKYPEFIRVGVSYVVNLMFVRGISGNILEMYNGTKIPIPRRNVAEVQKAYMDFCRREALR